MSARILLVEDDPAVRTVVADMLHHAGYAVEIATNGCAAAGRLVDGFDLILMDVILPGLDGFALCRHARERGFDGAILMLTARREVEDRVAGLLSGADDYVGKPFEPPELLARVAALLRRVQREALLPVVRFRFGPVEVDFASGAVTRDGKPVELAPKELQLLRYLVNRRGTLVTREQALREVWSQQPFITPRTVDTHIAWLRQKLEPTPTAPKHILTVRGEGYRFEP